MDHQHNNTVTSKLLPSSTNRLQLTKYSGKQQIFIVGAIALGLGVISIMGYKLVNKKIHVDEILYTIAGRRKLISEHLVTADAAALGQAHSQYDIQGSDNEQAAIKLYQAWLFHKLQKPIAQQLGSPNSNIDLNQHINVNTLLPLSSAEHNSVIPNKAERAKDLQIYLPLSFTHLSLVTVYSLSDQEAQEILVELQKYPLDLKYSFDIDKNTTCKQLLCLKLRELNTWVSWGAHISYT